MKPLFVRIHDGQPIVQWRKLTAFSIAVMIVTAVLVEGLWFLFSSHMTLGALVVAIFLGALVVTRLVVRAVTYQEQELEVESTSASS
jgi:membrane protein YdbS with pleckstrin-like domain